MCAQGPRACVLYVGKRLSPTGDIFPIRCLYPSSLSRRIDRRCFTSVATLQKVLSSMRRGSSEEKKG
ncbi:hypothetical protein POVWA2_011540 [Plasmodium ovale wallikeri]|uniref:Uncharacterized protein n=1 Tax=Plasmodium ovale wallikeri TaxID=864142 RepID=A0A1A8YN34_PLAOA|nr:hypothetical protein POVWA2_011540 [Plasmodium ovale wallikeri]SBT44631.1 hypothetical protein POVWA1_050180 [Plasmodium ovale wallikeri]